uniref:Bromo domain-containing protein n=1 Tax=Globodera rostochiensis TaxID=31243 RepID=A0A914H2H9_GLORO
MDAEELSGPSTSSGCTFIPPSQRGDAPLAGILPPEFEDIDPKRFFPDFEQDGILRFSRVFASNTKPTMKNQIWWTSRTFKRDNKKAAAAPTSDDKCAQVEEAAAISTIRRPDAEGQRGDGEKLEKEEAEQSQATEEEEDPWALRFGPPPKKEDCCTDEYELLCAENLDELLSSKHQNQTNEDDDEAAPPWRFGPAQMWYDRLGVPANPTNFDYGLKRRGGTGVKASSVNETDEGMLSGGEDDRDFLPVNLLHWEDDIIIDPEQAREKLVKELSSVKLPRCGWIPTPYTRNYKAFMTAWKNKSFIEYLLNPSLSRYSTPLNNSSDISDSRYLVDSQHSLFPFDNYELENTRWEDDIIWDSANMPTIPKPRILTLDYEDDPRAFGMPEDTAHAEDVLQQQHQLGGSRALGKDQGVMKKSKLILAQVLKRQRQEVEEQIETQIAQIADKDPFNLSNDEYYMPKSSGGNAKTQRSLANLTVQHSLPAQNLHPALFPLLQHSAAVQLRHFHRVPLNRRAIQGMMGRNMPVQSLMRHIRLKSKEHQHLADRGGGFELFVMRELHNLTGRDGTLVAMEYVEEHPPLLNQTGMASKIRNYYKKKLTKEEEKREFEFGETAFSHTSPFLGDLSSNESVQAIENNMYRATVFQHRPLNTDFLLIRNKYGLFIRPFPALFAVGQQLPLYEVPTPNSKRAKDFNKDFMMSYMFRLFWQSEDLPKRIRMDEIKQMFPGQEGIIRKNLKQCAELRRIEGHEYWMLREDYRLPNREETSNMVTPEMYCAYASMLAAEQRLKDAGYGEKYLHVPENADDSDDQQNMEDEIKCAPWNVTKSYISAMKGKCLLDQSGIADPTGADLGFSFVRVSTKPQKPPKEEVEKDAPKKLVTGTSADLRKLSLKEARQMCREFGLTDEEIGSLERWDVIDVIRTMSTQAAQGSTDSQVARFARGNARATLADMQNKHKEHCQRMFERQNKWLRSSASADAQQQQQQQQPTSDEEWRRDESDDDDDDDGRCGGGRGKKLYSTTVTLTHADKRKLEFEREERERLDLQRMIRGEVTKGGSSTVSVAAKEAVAAAKGHTESHAATDGPQDAFTVPNPQNSVSNSLLNTTANEAQRKLRVYRIIKNRDGTESTRIETVSHPQLIEAYVRIRTTRDDNFIKVYAQMDDQYKEEKRKERRRQQQQEGARRSKKGGGAGADLKSTQRQDNNIAAAAFVKSVLLEQQQRQQQQQQKQEQQKELTASATTMAATPSPNKPGPKPKMKSPMEKKQRKEKPPPPPPKQKDLKITCSACGAIGHMKTNRNCPLYGKDEDLASKTVGEICQPSTSKLSDVPDEEGDRLPSGELIEVEGTRLKISKKLYKHAEKERKDALRLHIPRKILERSLKKKKKLKKANKEAAAAAAAAAAATVVAPTVAEHPPEQPEPKAPTLAVVEDQSVPKARAPLTLSISIASLVTTSVQVGPLSAISSTSSTGGGGGVLSSTSTGAMKRRGTIEEADYLMGPLKSVHRRRADPRVSMASVLMEILNELKNIDGSEHFACPVNIRKVPDYLEVVKKPMDLQQIRKNVSENKYELRRQFLEDLTQILANSITYNGPGHPITEAARRMLEHATKRLEDSEQKLIELEKQINPLLDDDDMVGFSHILQQIVQECKNLPKSAAFHARVDPKKFPQYNDKIQRPMDLGTIEQNIKDHRYTTVNAFRRDIEQILINSRIFNGAQSAYTLKAEEIVEVTNQLHDKSKGHLAELEANIQKALSANQDGARGAEAEAEEGAGGAVMLQQQQQQDLVALNDQNTEGEEDEMLMDEEEMTKVSDEEETGTGTSIAAVAEQMLHQSAMHTSGQLNADLALSDSDDEQLMSAKKPKLDDFDASL